MMMVVEDEFQDRDNLSLDDIDLSLLSLSSPPYDYSPSSFLSAASPEKISPLKRSSPVSAESDQPKRRKISPQNPILINSPLRFTYPETQSSSVDDPTRFPNLTAGQIRCSHASSVPEKQETSPSACLLKKRQTMKMLNNHVEEINREETNYDAYEEINREETNYDADETTQQEEEEKGDCGEGMRIERSGDGFVIRLKCRCKLAFRVLFSDNHLYFKPL